MPYPNWHSARMIDPGRFVKGTFRNKTIAPGIEVIFGKMPGRDVMVAQTYRFVADRFTAEEAKKWMADYKLRHISFEAASGPKKAQAFVSIRSRGVQALTGVDIMSMVPSSVIEELKRRDPHPFLQAYSICHEGVSAPRVLGDTGTARPILWTRAAVQSIKNIALKGVRFFLGHNEDNSTQGRRALGEVVWDGQKEIDGVLHHVVVGYFPNKSKVQALDICSQEGNWDFLEAAGRWVAEKLDAITGIALSSSSVDQPAFSGARRLAQVQALEVELEDEMLDDLNGVDDDSRHRAAQQNRRRTRMDTIDLTTVNFDDLAQELRRRKTFPSQLFTLEDVKKDNTFQAVFSAHDEATKQLKEKETELTKLKGEKAESDKRLQTTTAKERFVKLVDAATLTPKQKEYVKNSYPEKLDDSSDEALQKLITLKVEDYKVAVKTFGITDDALPAPAKGAEVPASSGAEGEFASAKQNPLLEEDLVQ